MTTKTWRLLYFPLFGHRRLLGNPCPCLLPLLHLRPSMNHRPLGYDHRVLELLLWVGVGVGVIRSRRIFQNNDIGSSIRIRLLGYCRLHQQWLAAVKGDSSFTIIGVLQWLSNVAKTHITLHMPNSRGGTCLF